MPTPRGGFLEGGRGPALPLREETCWRGLGVPGPREDWRRDDEVEGIGSWPLSRRRLAGSLDGERAVVREAGG